MPIELKMPKLGESVTEGTISRWLKQPGERIELYEPLLEVTTDKVDTEVTAPLTGSLVEIRVPDGETVGIGTVIAILSADDEQPTATPAAAGGQGEPGRAATRGSPSEQAREAAGGQGEPGQATTQGGPSEQAQASAGWQGVAATPGSLQGFISPVVAKLAAEHAVDLREVQGSGRDGRITKQDVERYLRQGRPPARQQDAPAPAATPVSTAARQPDEATDVASQRTAAGAGVGSIPGPTAAALDEGDELVPLTAMRRAIAEHMVHSKRTAPHVTTVMEADLSKVIAHRQSSKAEFERQGARLTVTPYLVQSCVRALQEVPLVNASYSEAGLLLHRAINIGVAVAIPDGLLVPVIRDADEKSLLGLARAVNDLAERARARRLQPDELAGGTFTITNHGVSGSLFAMPIINQPQAAILGVGAIQKRPVVITQHGVDAIAIRPMCYLSLTFDHRIMDGATADRFLASVKQALEGWG